MQIPEAALMWISNGTCWDAGKVHQLVSESNRVCSCAVAPALLNPVEDPLIGHARLRLTPCVVTGSVASVSELGFMEECSLNRGKCILLQQQHAN